MVQYLDELKEVIDKYGFNENELIIVGSGTLTNIGFRNNNDIEICLTNNALKNLPVSIRIRLLFFDHVDLNDNIDLFKNRYLNIGITDNWIFNSKSYNFFDSFRIVKPEIEYCYKVKKNRKKDKEDLKVLRNSKDICNTLDWKYIDKLNIRPIPKRYKYYDDFRIRAWNLSRHIITLWIILKKIIIVVKSVFMKK